MVRRRSRPDRLRDHRAPGGACTQHRPSAVRVDHRPDDGRVQGPRCRREGIRGWHDRCVGGTVDRVVLSARPSLGTRCPDAAILLLLATFSAAGQFWLAVPETAALGSASVMGAVAAGVWAAKRPLRERWLIVASVGSLAITVTNWIAGLAAAAAALPWRRAVQVSVNAFAIVVALWAVQRAIVPNANFFIGYSNEQRYLLRPEAAGPLAALRAVAVTGMVMPRLDTVHKGPTRVDPYRPAIARRRSDVALVDSDAAVVWLGRGRIWRGAPGSSRSGRLRTAGGRTGL